VFNNNNNVKLKSEGKFKIYIRYAKQSKENNKILMTMILLIGIEKNLKVKKNKAGLILLFELLKL
jgi:hypothetical protein